MVTTSPVAPQRRVPVHRSAKDKAPRACDLGLAEDWEGASDEGCPVARDGVKESAVRVKEIVAGERGWVDAKAVRTAGGPEIECEVATEGAIAVATLHMQVKATNGFPQPEEGTMAADILAQARAKARHRSLWSPL